MKLSIPRAVLSFEEPFLERDVMLKLQESEPSVDPITLEGRIHQFLESGVSDGLLWRSGSMYEVRIRQIIRK